MIWKSFATIFLSSYFTTLSHDICNDFMKFHNFDLNVSEGFIDIKKKNLLLRDSKDRRGDVHEKKFFAHPSSYRALIFMVLIHPIPLFRHLYSFDPIKLTAYRNLSPSKVRSSLTNSGHPLLNQILNYLMHTVPNCTPKQHLPQWGQSNAKKTV